MARPGRELPSWRSLIMGWHGAVASNHPLATQAGMDVLRSGGTAFDASIAVATTLAVVEPYASGVGGDGIYLLYDRARQKATVVQAVGAAPQGATLERFATGLPQTGAAAALPPAAAAGWAHIVRNFATQPASELFAAAVHYARDGYPVSKVLSAEIRSRAVLLGADPACAKAFLPEGEPPRPGSSLRNTALAQTLEALGSAGGWDPSAGYLAKNLAGFSRQHGGVLVERDIEEVEAIEHEPLCSTYRGLKVLNAPPPSMGFTLLMELNILEQFGLATTGFLSAESVHLMVEAKKLAFREREQYAGDPRHVEIPLGRLLSKDHARELSFRLDPKRPTPSPGPLSAPGDTTYFCVVDAQGNAVSGIQGLGHAFGACVMDPKSGVLLGNRMLWFHLDRRHPNVLAPGKRPRHTINPPMALQGSDVRCVFGTPGGDGQVQGALQAFTAVFDHGLDPQQAVEAPRWAHFQPGTASFYPHDTPDVLLVESRFEPHVVAELKRRGHNIATVGPLDDACAVNMILRDPSGVLLCGADPRRDCWAGAF